MNEEQKTQLERESEFARTGKQVLDNPAFNQAITVRRAQIFEIFCNTSKDQSDIRDEAWRTMKNMDALESYFKMALETGKMADMQLKSLSETGK